MLSTTMPFNRTLWEQRSKDEIIEALKELTEKLNQERRRSGGFAEELRLAKQQSFDMQVKIEREEECISNRLLKRLEQLKNEKQLLANEVEQEEEFLTNTLQKKLEKLNREKVDLENQLEAEQEYIVNKLQKQVEQFDMEKRKLQLEKVSMQRQVNDLNNSVEQLNREKVNLESTMEMEEENIVNKMQKQLDLVLEKYQSLEGRLAAKGIKLCDIGAEPITIDNIRRNMSASNSPVIRYSWSFTPDRPGWYESGRRTTSQIRSLSTNMRDNLERRLT